VEYDVEALKELLWETEYDVDCEPLRVMEISSEVEEDDETLLDGDVVLVGVGRSSVFELVLEGDLVSLLERTDNESSSDAELLLLEENDCDGVRVDDGVLLPPVTDPEFSCDGVDVGDAVNDSSFVVVNDGLAVTVWSGVTVSPVGDALRVWDSVLEPPDGDDELVALNENVVERDISSVGEKIDGLDEAEVASDIE
jgi:hypothetical protein